MKTYQTSEAMTREFHLAAEHPVADAPTQISRERTQLRLSLVGEEFAEFVGAILGYDEATADKAKKIIVDQVLAWERHAHESGGYETDLVGLGKEGVDLHVVTSGTLLEHGVPEDPVYEVVHESNMAKAGGPKSPLGKSLKPDGWTPPDVESVIFPE